MYDDLGKQRVLVTGGANGIGYATAQRFIDEGSRVVILDNDPAALDKAGAELSLVGAVRADVSDPEEVEAAFKEMDEIVGGIDILVSNAGISFRQPFVKTDYEQWSRVLRVNLDGMYLCARAAIDRMKPQQHGVILFTASTNGYDGYPYYADYNASKAAVINLTKTIAMECAPWLRVNSVNPGYTLTPMQEAEYTPEMMAEVNAQIPLGRHADPSEIAALFAFLASSEARYITGTAITCDGGESVGKYTPVEE